MNTSSLFEWLESEGVSRSEYRLGGSMGVDALTLERLDDEIWRVFYSERGSPGRAWSFESENEGCMFLARKLMPQNFDRFILIADGDHRKRFYVHGLAKLRPAHPWWSFDGALAEKSALARFS